MADLVKLAHDEFDGFPYLNLPRARLHPHAQWVEQFRPSLHEVQNQIPDDLIRQRWSEPLETLTEGCWLKAWQEGSTDSGFAHPFEPRTWPPAASSEQLCITIMHDRNVYFEPFCAIPILLGELAEGRFALLQRMEQLLAPDVEIDTSWPAYLRSVDTDRLHPNGYSVRYKAIATAKIPKDKREAGGALDFCGHF